MTQAEQYSRNIRRLRHPGLLGLWNGIKAGATPGWPPGKAFEYLVLRAFELEKAEVRYPYNVRLASGINEQIDGVIYVPGTIAIVEAKDRGAMNVEPIAKLRKSASTQTHRRDRRHFQPSWLHAPCIFACATSGTADNSFVGRG